MKVVRIEDNLGIGLFNTSLDIPCKTLKEIEDLHWPMITPYFDSKLEPTFNSTYFCAYKSMDEMGKFVSLGLIKKLINLGLNVVELELSSLIEGDDQVIFLKSDIINKININHKFK